MGFGKANEIKTEEMVATEEATEKKNGGVVATIKSIVKELQASDPEITADKVRDYIYTNHPELNKSTVATQIRNIFNSQDPEKGFKDAMKNLFKAGNIALIGDEAKIEQMILIYGSKMTVEEVLNFLKEKPTGTKSLKINDLKNYVLVEAGKETDTDVKLVFANTTLFCRKA